MAKIQTLIPVLKQDGWVLLTETDVVSITFQVQKGEVQVRAADTNAPTDEDRGYIYQRPDGERQIDLALLSHTPTTRLWARANGDDAMVFVDYA